MAWQDLKSENGTLTSDEYNTMVAYIENSGQIAVGSFVAETSKTITHNFNTTIVMVQCYDSDGYQFLPNSIRRVDANTHELDFGGVSMTGSYIAMGLKQ